MAMKKDLSEMHHCEGNECENHNGIISFREFIWSVDKYKKALCYKCQQKALLHDREKLNFT
jgi:predicted Zn-dependent protease